MSPIPLANSIRTPSNKEYSYMTITETPDGRASQEQLRRLYTRYKFASNYCNNKDVLEVACGAGLGLGYLARNAKGVIGGDIDKNNLGFAQKNYKNQDKIEVVQLDAHNLPFSNKSFDIVILYEAIYYLIQPERFIEEARRVLRDEGILIICTVNKEWSGFSPSPLSHSYLSAKELYLLLGDKGFTVKLYADCPTLTDNPRKKVVSKIQSAAAKLNLLPKTLKGREKLKRVFFGKLTPLPPELTDDMGVTYFAPAPISHDSPNIPYKVLFAVGHIL